MAARKPGAEREFDYNRTVALSDGVFAIALTLLVLNIEVPRLAHGDRSSLWQALAAGRSEWLSYAISFAVIALLWTRHHAFFREVRRIDGRLAVLNLVYLGVVAFIPFPTRLLGLYGDRPEAVVVYATTIAAVGGIAAVTRLHARSAGLLAPEARRDSFWRLALVPLAFLVSIPIAFLSPTLAELSWISLALIGNLEGRRPA
ncbi:MAG: TMEM175 family protein [Solirubrobacteraceae bacterium]